MLVTPSTTTATTAHPKHLVDHQQQQQQQQQHSDEPDAISFGISLSTRKSRVSSISSNSHARSSTNSSGRQHANASHCKPPRIPSNNNSSSSNSKYSSSHGIESEVFLRNPKTGGFDVTPAQHEHEQHLLQLNALTLRHRQRRRSHNETSNGKFLALTATPSEEEEDDNYDDTTLNDSTVYTTYSRPPLLTKQPLQQSTQQQKSPISTTTTTATAVTPHATASKSRNPLSKISFQRYFPNKATKTPHATTAESPPTARATQHLPKVVSPSPSPSPPSQQQQAPTNNKGGRIVQQLRCVLPVAPSSSSPPTTTTTTPAIHRHDSHQENNMNHQHVVGVAAAAAAHGEGSRRRASNQSAASKDSCNSQYHNQQQEQQERQAMRDRIIMNSASARQRQQQYQSQQKHAGRNHESSSSVQSRSTASILETPPKMHRAYQPYTGGHNARPSVTSSSSSSSIGKDNNNRQRRHQQQQDLLDEDELSFLPKIQTKSVASSSCLDLSFSTVGPSSTACGSTTNSNNHNRQDRRTHDDSAIWSFDAVSPIHDRRRSSAPTVDDAISIQVSAFGLHTVLGGGSSPSSGFDGDQDESSVMLQLSSELDDSLVDPSTLDVGVRRPDGTGLSWDSRGAVLLTEAGLKRHNDTKLQQEHVEPLLLRQANGAGPLEKQVLMIKVERLQAKELQKEADASLELERAARKRRGKILVVPTSTATTTNTENGVAGGQDEDDRGAHVTTREPFSTPTRRTGPPPMTTPPRQTPTSLSPQTSTAPSPMTKGGTSPLSVGATKRASFFTRVFKKKPDAAELKRQWKERERERVHLALLEKEEAERQEQKRIESLRRTYLEKQRQLEAAASAMATHVIVDVDEVEPSPQKSVVDVDSMPRTPSRKGTVDVDDMASPNKSEIDVDDWISDQGDFFISSSPLRDFLVSSDNEWEELLLVTTTSKILESTVASAKKTT